MHLEVPMESWELILVITITIIITVIRKIMRLPHSVKRRHRHTLTKIKSTLDSLIHFFDKIMLPSSSAGDDPPPPPPPPFDPAMPANPISYPLKTLRELESRVYFESFHYSFNVAKVQLKNGGGGGGGLRFGQGDGGGYGGGGGGRVGGDSKGGDGFNGGVGGGGDGGGSGGFGGGGSGGGGGVGVGFGGGRSSFSSGSSGGGGVGYAFGGGSSFGLGGGSGVVGGGEGGRGGNGGGVSGGGGGGLPNRRRVLVCHDMSGGYGDDKWVQGGDNADAYAIWHWYLMDVFVYFSHYLVTLPPPCWTNAAHKHGVKVLGTFIMEWDEGAIMANELLSTKESAHMYAERLAELALVLGFDGWLINMEAKINNVPNLKEFISHLTQIMHSSVPGSLIIWYDSVTTSGTLDWQNQLNDKNKPFFDLCDGIFVNYTWKESYANLSAQVAGDRKFDVYMGIDVFGRGTYGGGQWTTNVALDVIKKNDVSAAIFAPGWVYENNDKKDFQTLQNRWWGLVEKSWGIVQKSPLRLPFYSNFDQGRGFHVSVNGRHISEAHWNNISSQSYQPFLEIPEESDLGSIQCFVDFKEASYSGGGNMTFRGSLDRDASTMLRLFEGDLLLESAVTLTCSVRSGGSSLLGIVLHLSSAINETKTLLLPSSENTLLAMEKFSRLFNHVITPHQVTKVDTEPGWTINEFSFAFKDHTLTKISAQCYKLENVVSVQATPGSSGSDVSVVVDDSEYYAVLGHLSINTYAQTFQFPPSMSWVLESQYIKWSSSPQESNLSLKLSWRLENGNADFFVRYNIYVRKMQSSAENPDEAIEGLEEYLGVSEIEEFYVNALEVPSGIATLKFIVQACSPDGDCQKLQESPFLQLEVENLKLEECEIKLE